MPDGLRTTRHFLHPTLSVCSRWSQTAPPKGELIALPEAFVIHPIRFGYRKKLPPRGSCRRRRLRGFRREPLPSCRFASSHTPPFVAARHLPPERGKSSLKGTAFGGGGKVSGIAIRRPLGGAGALAPEGVQAGAKTVWKTTIYVRFPHRAFLSGGLWKTARGKIPDWRKANP